MKKWYWWLYLALGFAISGIAGYFAGRSVLAAVFPAGCMALMGLLQFVCDKKGEKGKKAFQYISIAAIVLLAAWLIYLVSVALR